MDDHGRGVLQRAKGSGVQYENLKEWLLANATDPWGRPLTMTYGLGRDDESKASGRFGKEFRNLVKYDCKGKKMGGKGEGYKPTGSSSSSGRW